MKAALNKIIKADNYTKFYWFAITFLILIGSFIFYVVGNDAYDVFFILRTGRDILETGKIPNVNEYVINGNNFVVQQWLYAVIVAFITNIFEHQQLGLYLFFTLEAILCIFLYMKFRGLYTKRSYFDILFVAVFVFNTFYLNLRPELITIDILLFEMYSLSKYTLTHKKRWLVGLPISMLLMVNLHAMMWSAVYAILLAYVVPSVLPKRYPTNHLKINVPVFVSIIVSFGCIFINPYTYQVISMVYTGMHISGIYSSYITELITYPHLFKIIDSNNVFLFSYMTIIYVIEFILLLISFYKRGKGMIKSTTLYLCLGFTVLSFMHIRNIMFITLAFVALFTDCAVYFKEELLASDSAKAVCNKSVDQMCRYKNLYILLIAILFTISCFMYRTLYTYYDYVDCVQTSYTEGFNKILNDPDYDPDRAKLISFNYASYCEYIGMKNLHSDVRMEYSDKSEHNMMEYVIFRLNLFGQEAYSAKFVDKDIWNNTSYVDMQDFVDYYDFQYVVFDSASEGKNIAFFEENIDGYELFYFDEECLNYKEMYPVIFKRID